MRRLGLAVALVAALLPRPGLAGWGDFYRGSGARQAPAAAGADAHGAPLEHGVCVAEILRAQLRHRIPGNLLLAIGIQEAGVTRGGHQTIWPYAVNAAGEGRLFDSRAQALGWIAQRRAAGIDSIDVGCMQINMRWHPEAFEDTAQGFDPARNVDYAARFLRGLYEEFGDWTAAAGAYHSRTPEAQQVYLAALRRNIEVANDRIAGFRDIAGRGAASPVAPGASPLARGAMRRGWSAGGAAGGARFGIYSNAPLRPVIGRADPAS
ncbi:transglycosylase SLT domain-containing protein [Limimaricola hongkongensis]|uniref:Soluble lytic murein transglycosylase n=1 Tax=Limimaricola hongkongensis DSM 17492 TaxID=1122180 RepID=A0A017HGN0_9RHOB|nr:transglycosylase SLT domain-containing protein [Limimaricola hongkongensis]EYD73642.1 Soluble lytic murein transglycosylase [Limimaricola hongkongensis DSM 17492]